MTETKITFTKNNIDNSNPNVIELEVQQFEFSAKGNKKKVEKIVFGPLSDGKFEGKDTLKKLLEENQSFELSFDEGKVETTIIEPQPEGIHGCCAMGPEPVNQPPKIKVYEESKTLSIEWNPDIIKVAKQETTGGSWEGATKDAGNDQSSGNSSQNEETEDLNDKGNSGVKPEGDNTEDTSNSNQGNDNDNQTPPPNNQPTQEEINENREKLNQAAQGNDKEKISDSIKKNEELKDKGAKQSEEDKAAEEAARKKLAEDKKKYQETITKTIKNKLESNGVKKDELSPEANTNLEKLEGEEIIEPSQVDAAEKVIVEDTYKKAAEKKLTDLENKVNQATKSKNEKELKKLKQLLSQFIDNANYQSKKSEAEALIKKLENALKQNSNSNDSKDNKGDAPWKIVIPVALVAVAFLAGAIIYTRKKRLRNS